MTKPSAEINITPDIIRDFKLYHDIYPAWNSLHIALEDGNVDDDDIDFCINYAHEKGDIHGHKLALILRKMSKSQRIKISRCA